jgi:hypothetical protein
MSASRSLSDHVVIIWIELRPASLAASAQSFRHHQRTWRALKKATSEK